MSRTRRLAVFACLCALSGLWAASALLTQYVHVKHHDIVESARTGASEVTVVQLEDAVTDYTHALRWMPCAMSLHQDRLLLLGRLADVGLQSTDLLASDDALAHLHAALDAVVACNPTDGKAWLDLAIITLHQEGFTPRVLSAYAHSAQAAPGESWLAEQRLLFALQFLPLLDDAARRITHADIAVLERAHPNRMKAVMEAAKVDSPHALGEMFAH